MSAISLKRTYILSFFSCQQKNYNLLRKYAQEHNLRGELGLPLLFVSKNYIMGWSDDSPTKLQEYIEELKNENISRFPSSRL